MQLRVLFLAAVCAALCAAQQALEASASADWGLQTRGPESGSPFTASAPPAQVKILEFTDSSCRGSASSVLTRQVCVRSGPLGLPRKSAADDPDPDSPTLCAAPRRATSQLNTCQSSQDGKAGLEYACLKEGASVMQLSCPSDKRCAGNGSGGGCALNVYNSGQCIKSMSSNKFVQVKCAARQGGVFAPPPS